MSVEFLNKDLVTSKIKENGWTRGHVIAQLGLGQDGYKFLRGEWIPKDRERKSRLVRKLARILGVEVTQILLHIEVKKTG